MKKIISRIVMGLALTLPFMLSAQVKLTPEVAQDIAREAYVYAYPMVLMQVTRDVGTNVAQPTALRAPINQLAHASAFPDETFTDVVRANVDTLYTILTFDVAKEPLIIEIPDSKGRYHLMPFLDYWTEVFTVPGSRTTGDGPVTLAIVGQKWQGELPEGVRRYVSPTNFGLLIGRTQTNGVSDYAAVQEFQKGMKAYPLSAWGKLYTPPKGTVNPLQDMSAPVEQVEKMSGEAFFTLFAELLKNNPPHASDYPMLDRIAALGIKPGESFSYASAPKEVKEAIDVASQKALPAIKKYFINSGESANGWKTHLTAIGSYGTDYLSRAGVAYGGLGANLIEDATYPTLSTDSEGQPLQSDDNYVLHFSKAQIPPVNAFWSLTMYNDHQNFPKNEIKRFALGDRDNLKFNDDGSLDIYIQRDNPGKDKESNWLPTPEQGIFTMTMRLYWPKAEAIDGSWNPPAIMKVK